MECLCTTICAVLVSLLVPGALSLPFTGSTGERPVTQLSKDHQLLEGASPHAAATSSNRIIDAVTTRGNTEPVFTSPERSVATGRVTPSPLLADPWSAVLGHQHNRCTVSDSEVCVGGIQMYCNRNLLLHPVTPRRRCDQPCYLPRRTVDHGGYIKRACLKARCQSSKASRSRSCECVMCVNGEKVRWSSHP